MADRSLLKRTRQESKLLFSAGVGLLGFVAMLLGLRIGMAPSSKWFLLVPIGIVVGLLGLLVFPAFAVRCPRCGSFWVWRAMNSGSSSDWNHRLLVMEECPTCGYGGADDGKGD